MLICDTGPLVAAALHADIHHHESVELFTGMHLAGRDLVLPPLVIAEVGYLLAREASAEVESSFLRSLADGAFKSVELTRSDYGRMADLVGQYADLPLGATDAAVIALAERLGVDEIATIDRRHFTVVRPRHVRAFTLLP
ncbi:type II toxin-antitoxin system VapC family toxin [Saccharomonospora iraqiensis]|uniref:type II toxin-antitoxin system VapC family toxin n=1 Tax=Saccharomonospora iraqiensis TaxID=52698 RepID=UPI00048DDD5C|nr:PIN domain-containing protein [Saccharomonospora iraqiensis]